MLSGVVFHGGDVKKALVPGSLELVKGSFKKLKIIDQWRIFWHELFMLATNNGELASQSALADIASDDKAIGEIRKKLAEEAEFWADNPEQIDAELASFIASRSRLSISDNTVIEEIKALRQTLRVKRSYNAAKKRVISN